MVGNYVYFCGKIMGDTDFIGKKLIEWYMINRRELPWRSTQDPYRIWISEVILQQTRVVQGLNYYLRFMERFPNVQSLADADEQEVLKYWQGLGYYSRARNLHLTAQIVRDQYHGVFPKNYEQIKSLKGIGDYTAAAIVSFAWNLPYPVVDGNVFRFLSRFFLIDIPIDTQKGKNYFMELAGQLMDRSQPGLFNQAIMEFGALQCIPASPDCLHCPFSDNCLAFARQAVADYPVKQHKTQTKGLYLYYFHIRQGSTTYLTKRAGKGIWQNLFEFPMVESEQPLDLESLLQNDLFAGWLPAVAVASFRIRIQNRKHVLSHRILYATFIEVYINKELAPNERFFPVETSTLEDYPVHRLMQYYLENSD
ncbi:MAG: A/G-specific adenine glycosylase [Dysgonamonadaceae bacterium]|jgi:A/G-specific adenine glycosylase|nr:A/G-specific adenine glycosylase [Dysgonamonadaceae bacterium]